MVAKLNCNSLETIHGWMVVLYGQSLLHRLFHWKSFTVTNRSAKAAMNDLQYTIIGPISRHCLTNWQNWSEKGWVAAGG